jgi:hypothetical protein
MGAVLMMLMTASRRPRRDDYVEQEHDLGPIGRRICYGILGVVGMALVGLVVYVLVEG